MLILYVASTGDGWDTLMFATMDATEPGFGPQRNDASAAALFSIVWMFGARRLPNRGPSRGPPARRVAGSNGHATVLASLARDTT